MTAELLPDAKKSGVTPFEDFFENAFEKLLANVPDVYPYSCPTQALRNSSWDRKAAFIIFTLLHPEADVAGNPDEWTVKVPDSTYCSECGLLQFGSPSGLTCLNGHGGADSIPGEVHMWYHPESGSLFTTEPGEEFPADGLVEHLDKDSYDKIKARTALMERYAMDPFEGGADETSFEL